MCNKIIHKGAWKVLGTNIVNQIGHVVVSQRHALSISDVRSARAPNCDPDHCMVKAVGTERISVVASRATGRKRKRWIIDGFKNDQRKQVSIKD